MDKNYEFITFISKYLSFKKAEDFFKVLKDLKKFKKLEIMHQNTI